MNSIQEKNILVTGGNGLLGNAMRQLLPLAHYPSKKQLDLLDKDQINRFIINHDIKTVIHLAAKVGGVGANIKYVADFYSDNIIMNTNLVNSCISNAVPKLVCCLSTCIFPDSEYVQYPLTEDQLHSGPPHESNFGYAYSKRMVDVHLRAARQQHGLEYISVVPNNLYGENDNFNLDNGHVLPSLIRKVWEAKINSQKSFTVWGDGEIYREFTYSLDIAKATLFCLENYKDTTPINIGNNTEYLLKDVIKMICQFLEYDGEVIFDISKPKGQNRKPTSNKKLIDLGWDLDSYTNLENGLKNTCEWFKKNYPYVRGMSI